MRWKGLVQVKRGLRAPRGQTDVVYLSALSNGGTQKCCGAVKTWLGSGECISRAGGVDVKAEVFPFRVR